jgi:two-component system, cell cycle sensor histidine kinase and response regulator CckA
VCLPEVLDELADLLKSSIGKNITLIRRLDPKLAPIIADPSQIHQIAMNLLVNAAEAIGSQHGTIVVTAGQRTYSAAELASSRCEPPAPGPFVFLSVQDDGCGMDSETLERLFDPFFSTKFTGRGLGMAAVLGIVRGHGGAIFVRSAPNQGTTTTVLFPVQAAAEQPVRKPVPEVEAEGSQEALQGTVLVVDDEDFVRDFCARTLKFLGCEVLVAPDGEAALEIVRGPDGGRIDCVILDLTMPHLDGKTTCQALRRLKPDLPVLLSSGYNEEEVTGDFVDLALSGFLQKPYRIEQLVAALRHILPVQKKSNTSIS